MGGKVWLEQDKQALVDGCHKLAVERNLKIPFERGVLVNLALEVMDVWPATSRRFVSSVQQVKWVETAILERMTPTSSETAVETIPVPTTAELVQDIRQTSALWNMIRTQVMEQPVIQNMIDTLTEEVVEEIADKARRELLARANKKLTATPEADAKPAAVSKTATESEPPRKSGKAVSLQDWKRNLKTIVVMGLYAEQAEILKREFMGKAIIHVPFVEHLAAHDIAKEADVVFLITAKINHTVEEYVRSFVAKEKFRYVTGTGLSAAKRDIYRYLEQQQASA